MRAYREANNNGGTSILTLAEFNAIPVASRSSDILYIIGTLSNAATTTERRTVTISDVWVGNVPQNFLVDNAGALVWVGNVDNSAASPSAITGFTNAAVNVDNLV